MKKIFNYIMLFAIALTGLSLTACSEDDGLNTNQFVGGVTLNVYGPQPVMRGGTLRFIGSNLDQVAQVQIPGVEPITNIEVVKAGVPSEIRVQVPKDGPLPGKVTLVTKTDNKIETLTELTYSEPIVIESIPATTVMPGQTITISGDYLNLMHMVEFADGVRVSEKNFVKHDRYAIEVVVPEQARTGKLKLYDLDLTVPENNEGDPTFNIMETETALIVGTPAVAKLASPRGEAAAQGVVEIKMNETLTITGEAFNLIDSVLFTNVYVKELTVSEDGKTLSLVVPAEAPDGDVNLVCKSGVEVPVGKIKTVVPTECVAAPAPVKNGAPLTISGKDIDVVVAVKFPNVADAVAVQAVDGKISIEAVPETAQDGEGIMLVMANGNEVPVAYTLVKPVVTAYDNNPVSAGGALTISGTDLDLVKSVSFGCDALAVEASADGTAITLTVPMEAVSGVVSLNLKNGTTVDAPEISIEEAVFCYAEALPTDEDEIHAGDVLTLTVKNIDKLTGVEINGTACQYIVSGNKLLIGVPENAKKGSKVRIISSNGEITYTIDFIPNTEVTTVLWSGMSELGWSGDGQVYFGTDGGPELIELGAKAGDELCIKFNILADDWCFQLWEGHWGQQFAEVHPEDYDLAGNKGCYYLTLTDELIAMFTTQQWWGGMLLVQGQGLVLTQLSLVQHFSLETTLWEGEAVADDWGNQPTFFSDGGAELLEAGMKVGSTIRFYITPLEEAWNLQVWEGHWGGSYNDLNQDNYNLSEHGGAIEMEVTAEIYGNAVNSQGWGNVFLLNGDNVKCTKITIE